jgi:sugar diacid utilization regulator
MLRWPETGAYAIAVSDDLLPDRLRIRRTDYVTADGAILVRDPADLTRLLAQAGATGGVSARFARLDDAPEALRQATVAALCARAGLGPVAAYDRLGSWALIASLWDGAGRPQPPAPIVALTRHRRAAQLIEALEGLLEHGGDVAAAAAALSMHRATLYRRLERVEEITGLDLQNGDDRLLAHLGLRLQRLNATTVASATE